MKKLICTAAIITVAASVFFLSACSGKRSDADLPANAAQETEALEQGPPENTAEADNTDAQGDNDEIAVLQDYFDSNFNAASAGCAFSDFDSDGKKEMLVAEYSESATHMLSDFSLSHYRVTDGAVKQTDRFVVSENTYEGFLPSQESVYEPFSPGEAPDGAEELMVYLHTDNTIYCVFYGKMNNWAVRYMRFSVRDDRIESDKHLWDPGETSGLSISDYDTYFDHNQPFSPLFSIDEMGEVNGTYDSYQAALQGNLGGNISWEQFHAAQSYDGSVSKGQIVPNDDITMILNFKNY